MWYWFSNNEDFQVFNAKVPLWRDVIAIGQRSALTVISVMCNILEPAALMSVDWNALTYDILFWFTCILQFSICITPPQIRASIFGKISAAAAVQWSPSACGSTLLDPTKRVNASWPTTLLAQDRDDLAQNRQSGAEHGLELTPPLEDHVTEQSSLTGGSLRFWSVSSS